MEEGYVLEVEPGKTYLLRFINAVLTSEHYLKIAGHKLTVVAADANYVNPYTTDTVAIAPGQTLDALLVADAPPRRSYYMVSMGSQPTIANPPPPVIVTRGTVQYRSSSSDDHEPAGNGVPLPSMVPDMPDLHDTATSFYFHGNLTSLHKSRVPTRVDEHLLIVLSAGSICRRGHRSCKRSGDMESNVLVTMNNISFELPAAAAAAVTPLLESHYYHRNEPVYVTLPDRPQRAFNFTDHALIPFGTKEAALEPTGKATTARRFRHGMAWLWRWCPRTRPLCRVTTTPCTYTGTTCSWSPRDVTTMTRREMWHGVWYVHCHYEYHITIGMAAVFIVEDGPTVNSTLPPPPADLPKCNNGRH
nr:unnamed protein product [Digitaria exilis]